MTILSQSLFTLVGSHLVALLLLSVRHSCKKFYVVKNLLYRIKKKLSARVVSETRGISPQP